MANMKLTTFDDIVRFAGEFVTRQKGKWEHAEWLEFLKTLQGKGIDLSEEAQRNLGQILEASKSFYQAVASVKGIEKTMRSVSSETVDFVKKHQGVWGHDDWESFVKKMQQDTVRLTAENANYLGGILESVKAFYSISPVSIDLSPAPQVEKKSTAKAAVEPRSNKTTAQSAEPTAQASPTQATPAAKPAEDDLTAIAGIGPALRRKLNEQGIHSFAQIAALSDEDIERLEGSIIKFSGRIKRDDWIGQARRFSKDMR